MQEIINSETFQSIIDYGYLVMFLVMLLEGPFITFTCAFIASSLGYFNIVFIIILGIFGDFVGDLIYYYIGRGSHNIKLISKFSENKVISSISDLLEKKPLLGMIVAKFTPYSQIVSLTFIGFIKFSSKKFIFYSFLLSIPSSIIFGLGGYFLGETLYSLYKEYQNIYIIIFGIIFFLLIIYITYNFITTSISKYIVKENEKEKKSKK